MPSGHLKQNLRMLSGHLKQKKDMLKQKIRTRKISVFKRGHKDHEFINLGNLKSPRIRFSRAR